MNVGSPVVSVVMPVYNGGEHLRPAVLSMLEQSFADFELILIDDGSTDGAVDALMKDIGDPRVRLIKNERNLGLSASLNKGIDVAHGRYLARMDCDDIAYPQRLERQVAFLNEHPSVDLVAVRSITISAENAPIGVLPWAETHAEIVARPWLGFYLPHPTWMGRAEWFRRHYYRIPEVKLCEDQELLLRSYEPSRFATIPEILFAYRLRTNQDWNRQSLVRRNLALVQISHFHRHRQWWFLVLATSAYLLRKLLDAINRMLPSGSRLGAHGRALISEEEVERWYSVMGRLRSR